MSIAHASGLSWATFVSAVVILTFGAAVLWRARGSRLGALFFAITVAVTGWLAGFSVVYETSDPSVALRWARLATLFAYLIPAAIFHFSVVYAGRLRRFRVAVVLCWIVAIVVGVLAAATNIFIPGLWHYAWGYYPRGSAFHVAGIIPVTLIVALGTMLIWRATEGKDPSIRARRRAVVVAFVAGSFGIIDYLPTVGIGVPPAGFVVALVFIALATVAIWRFHLVELTAEYAAAQILRTMKSAVVVADLDGQIRVANQAALALLGYQAHDLVGQPIRTIIDPDDESMSTGRLLRSTGTLELQMGWRTESGNRIDMSVSSSFIREIDGTPVGVVYVATDVTERRKAEQALRESEHRYRTLFEGNPLPMWVYDFETLRFIAVNEAAVRHYGYSKDEFLQMTIADIRPVEELPRMRETLLRLHDRDPGRIFRHRKKDGTVFDAEITSFEFVSAGRRARLVIAIDVTERYRAEERLRESEERYRLLFERNLAGVYRSTLEGRILEVNDAMARTFGYDREELLKESANVVYFSAEERARLMTLLREQRVLSNVEVRMRRRDGTPIWVLENMTLLESADGIIEGTIVDITDRKNALEQVEYQAYHDVLTALPNRLLFRDRITVALAHARRTRRAVAVMFLDLDQFKLVNDTLGHTVGDGLLQAAAERLVGCIRAEDTVARMGGDEFTILLADLADSRDAALVAQKVLDSICQPIEVDGHELFVTTSIGIALFPDDGPDAETLLKNADRAMYRAKEAGRNNYQFATRAAVEAAAGRLSLERSLHHAFERHEFVVHYQPMIEIAGGRMVGAEALIRWMNPEIGMMSPDEFIPIAEECGLIFPIGEWVLRTACAQMNRWHGAGHRELHVSVNLSARQFQQHDLTAMIERILDETALPADSLHVEITESTAMHNAELSLAIMTRLKQMGVHISIDDFGTGYSSLSYLKRFPIDTVKIDQDFVRDLSNDSNDAAIISAVISMARALKLRVVAEGVETEEQLAFLRRQRCEAIQGFLYSRPLSAEEFETALAEQRR